MLKRCLPLILLLCAGCELDFEDNKRLLFRGIIVDENNAPLPNLPVQISTSRSSPISGSFNEVLGNDFTDEKGSFAILTLSPTAGDVLAEINSKVQKGYIPSLVTYRVSGVRKTEEIDATYTLPQLRVERLIDTQLEIRRTGSSNDTLFYEFKTGFSEKQLDLGFAEIQDEEPMAFFSPFGTLLPTESEKQELLMRVPAKDTIEFRYSFSNKLGSDVLSKDLFFDVEKNSYVFEF
ncbi:MAG: hypothetical protein ACFCUL_08410 [Flavobacteriaceae bacterium]